MRRNWFLRGSCTLFVRGNKNDFTDAETICEAASRPAMRFAAPKTEAQQTLSVLYQMRDLLMRAPTKTANRSRRWTRRWAPSLKRTTWIAAC